MGFSCCPVMDDVLTDDAAEMEMQKLKEGLRGFACMSMELVTVTNLAVIMQCKLCILLGEIIIASISPFPHGTPNVELRCWWSIFRMFLVGLNYMFSVKI